MAVVTWAGLVQVGDRIRYALLAGLAAAQAVALIRVLNKRATGQSWPELDE